jgi:hypothetical protein
VTEGQDRGRRQVDAIPHSENGRASVVLDGDEVLISNLVVHGAVAQLVSHALAESKDPEAIVRQAVEIGAAVLLQGAAIGTLDAISAEVDRVLTALQTKITRLEVARQADERISSSKGQRFEDEIGPVLDGCFGLFGDELEFTGRTRGIANDIVGDFVVTVNPHDAGGERRVVFETKNHKKAPTVEKALAELERGMINRDAQVGVFVFPAMSKSPLKGKHLRLYHGNRILVVWDPEGEDGSELALEVATQLARSLAIITERRAVTLDQKMLADWLAELTLIIERGSAIGRGLSTARKGIKAAEDAYKTMREDALAMVWELDDLVAGGDK